MFTFLNLRIVSGEAVLVKVLVLVDHPIKLLWHEVLSLKVNRQLRLLFAFADNVLVEEVEASAEKFLGEWFWLKE